MKKILCSMLVIVILSMFMYSPSKALEMNKITVDIKGAVNVPGTYEIEQGSTVYDLIGLAGGLRSYADTSLINLSKKLKDEDVVIIYTIDEVTSYTTGDRTVKVVEKECMCPKIENVSCINKLNNSIGIININTASLEELQKLSGIGASKAKSIIEYRNNTPFISIEDIMKVKGIGKTIYEKIKDNITV